MIETVTSPRMYYPELADAAAANQHADTVPVAEEHLEIDGEAALSVRRWGAKITRLTLSPLGEGDPVRILYADTDDIANPHMTASFAISPVGASDVHPGGLHGMYQNMDYQKEPAIGLGNGRFPDNHSRLLRLVANHEDTGLPLMSREFRLTLSQLALQTVLFNQNLKAMDTSLGEQFHLLLGKDGDIHNIKISNQRIDSLLADGAERQLRNGDAVYWPEFNGQASIEFPDGHVVSLHARASIAYMRRLGMKLWYDPDQDSDSRALTFQPALGVRPSDENAGITIPQRSHATLTTSLELMQPATR